MNRVKNCVFLVRKWSFNIVNIQKMWEKKGKSPRTRSMTKKGHQKFLPRKWEFFLKLGREKNFWSPQIRRQVSAHGEIQRYKHKLNILIICKNLKDCLTKGNSGVKPSLSIYSFIHSFIHSFIQTISIAHLQVPFYSEALPTQHGYCARVSRRSATGNCELRTCPRSLRGG